MKVKDLTGISPEVREKVYQRDEKEGCVCCIYCGRPSRGTVYIKGVRYETGIQIAHYIGRAQLGKGIPENLASMCDRDHWLMDNCKSRVNERREFVRDYLRAHHPGWDEKKLIATKEEMYG